MSSCRVTDSEAKILVAECLGELGAVDPGRSAWHSSTFSLFVKSTIQQKIMVIKFYYNRLFRLDKLTNKPVYEQTVFEVTNLQYD